MNTPFNRTANASVAILIALFARAAHSFTDANAELKEVGADRPAQVIVVVQAERPQLTAWVPMSKRSLDGFKPIFPEAYRQAGQSATQLAKAQKGAKAETR